MTHRFDDDVQAAVLAHMNGDHTDDNVLIARAYGPATAGSDVISATMVGFDGDGGRWVAQLSPGAEQSVDVAWPGGPITQRAEVRREIVALYDESCRRLGIEPRPHA